MPNITMPCHAFTTRSSGLSNRLINEAIIMYERNNLKTIALWDTGATGTCISEQIAKGLSMIPTGKKNISTPSGTKEVSTYLIDIALPNQVIVQNVEVCETDIGNQGIGVLIGMDIISHVDFAVSNFKNQTIFTFRIPSREKIDFVSDFNTEVSFQPMI